MSAPDRDGRVQLHYAALTNDTAAARRCLSDGEDVNAADRSGFTPLHLAAQSGSLDVALLLLQAGAHVDSLNRFGNSPLFVAVFNSRGVGSMIELLRAWGADPFLMNESGQTPVGLARLIGNFDVAQYFADLV